MKTFEITFRYQDRGDDFRSSTITLDATTLSGAIAKATRQFAKTLDRKQRFDMNKNGLAIKGARVGSEKEHSTAAAAVATGAATE